MSDVLKAVLSHPQHPEHGQVTISFPIPNDQYDQTIKMLQAIDLGFSVNRDCKVNEVESPYSVLGVLVDTKSFRRSHFLQGRPLRAFPRAG